MDIFDIWVNLVTEQSAQEFVSQAGFENIPGYLGSNQGPTGVDKLLETMDELGVATGIFTGGLDRRLDPTLRLPYTIEYMGGIDQELMRISRDEAGRRQIIERPSAVTRDTNRNADPVDQRRQHRMQTNSLCK